MPDQDRMTLFIYGTLKRGHERHAALDSQQFSGEARTAPGYRMFDCGSYPGLIESNKGISILGELWIVDCECLSRLDAIECVDSGLYARSVVRLAPPHDRLTVETYLYLQSTDALHDVGHCWELDC